MIDTSTYVVTDTYFGAPYIDLDEQRETPAPHRHVHGGFTGTDTRFRFYFPPVDRYEGRMFNPLSGAHGGTEDFFGTPFGEMIGGFSMCMRLGGYMVESNQGHIGDDIDPRAGDDPSMYGSRASAEVARFSKHVAAQVYGAGPHHSYVFGGSGGGRRSPLCLENAPDAWDGALPFMGGGEIAEHGNNIRIRGAQVMSFATMFNVQRLLGDRLSSVVDAMAPGGSGDPFAGLSTHEREELATLYRMGYPRGDEYMIGQPMGQLWLWASMADDLAEQDPAYFENFWTKRGYVGHDQPDLVMGDLIDVKLAVKRVLTAGDLMTDEFDRPEFGRIRMMATIMGGRGAQDLAFALELEGVPDRYRIGTGVRVESGAAAGRQLYATTIEGNVFFCDGHGEANLQRFNGVKAGDLVHVDNRRFLAFCYFARHHLMDDLQFDNLRVDGVPIHAQHAVPLQSPLMGQAYSGQYEGKLMWVHHTHDASLWPPQGIIYANAVEQAQGADGAAEKFRLRWTQNAEHVPPMMLPSPPGRAVNTWLVDYQPVIEQSLADLVSWVEDGVAPAATTFTYRYGKVSLPAAAAERGGIQAVVAVSANGAPLAKVAVGEQVSISVHAELPPGVGSIISLEWDLDGSGAFATHDDPAPPVTVLTRSIDHVFTVPGTYFVTARVHSHREGDPAATSRRIPNVGQARIIVG